MNIFIVCFYPDVFRLVFSLLCSSKADELGQCMNNEPALHSHNMLLCCLQRISPLPRVIPDSTGKLGFNCLKEDFFGIAGETDETAEE